MEDVKTTIEPREQTMAKILFYLELLTDEQLRMAKGFIKGLGYKKMVSSPDTKKNT